VEADSPGISRNQDIRRLDRCEFKPELPSGVGKRTLAEVGPASHHRWRRSAQDAEERGTAAAGNGEFDACVVRASGDAGSGIPDVPAPRMTADHLTCGPCRPVR
jgi:hypothetical protein